MRVVVTGAAGMLGKRLTAELAAVGRCGEQAVTAVELIDLTRPETPDASAVPFRAMAGDLADPAISAEVAERNPDVVFHLAGVVSGEAERDREKGYRVNLDATRLLFESLASTASRPRVVLASSIAVFGAPFPSVIPDDFHPTPLTSYGTQKAMAELLLCDLSRRGLVDGVAVRLPTISVRPGGPNAAASGFFSGIIREPLAGRRAVLPVARSVRHPHASPRSAIGFLLGAAGLDTGRLGDRRSITMPSLAVTVDEQIEALRRQAGDAVADLIDEIPDPEIATIVRGWPEAFEASRAAELGFTCETSYDQIIAAHIADEMEAPPGVASP